MMFTYSVRTALSVHCKFFKTSKRCLSVLLQQVRARCNKPANAFEDEVGTVLKLFVDRGYISPEQADVGVSIGGVGFRFAPLGVELKRNLLEKWWDSVVRSRAQVFAVSTQNCTLDTATGTELGQVKKVYDKRIRYILEQNDLSKEQLIEQVNALLQRSPSERTDFVQGALAQFVPSSELVNRRLPFGLAETGECFQVSHTGSGWPAAVTQTSLVWFCSPRSSSQWLDYWARQRLQWWKKFALSPLDFSCSDVSEKDLDPPVTRGVKICYNFPWGQEPLETLWSRGDAELLRVHNGVRTKLQCRDGRKSVPHVVTVTANMDRGVMAFLLNSLQHQQREDSKRKLHQRKVLKLHPILTPIKVALDIGRGSTMELRQVCEGVLQELLDSKISTWPGYQETMPISLEQLNARYDEMGVLFTTVINENTLENGLLQVRSRDTTVRETMHISEIKGFLSKYVSAAQHI